MQIIATKFKYNMKKLFYKKPSKIFSSNHVNAILNDNVKASIP